MLNFDQIQAINEWLEQLDDNHADRKRFYYQNMLLMAIICLKIILAHYRYTIDRKDISYQRLDLFT